MLVPSLVLAALALAAAPQEPASAAARVAVRVDPRVELMTLIARLAGFQEFNMANSASPYATRVQEHFGPLAEHPVLDRLKALRATRGVSYDAISSLAVHLGPLPELVELAPFDAPPERLDARWGGAEARAFLAELRDFAQVSEAASFFAGEREFYAEVERRLAARLAESKALPWFDAFFGARGTARTTAIPGLLCGGGCFGVGIRYPDGRPEEITPVFGCWSWDAQGLPVFDASYLPLFVHELCHSYTNALVDRFARELLPVGERLFAASAEAMKRQAYPTGKIVLYETLVRASVVRCRVVTEGSAAGQAQAEVEVGNGFRWVPALARRFGDYEADRERWPSFADFVPEIVKVLEAEATAAEAALDGPRLVSIVPANGAEDVDPSLGAMVLTFDREMRDQSWSIAGNPAEQPKIAGALAYDAARTVLTVPIQLEPGRTYRFWLNSPKFTGFKDKDGTPLLPVEVSFTTRAR